MRAMMPRRMDSEPRGRWRPQGQDRGRRRRCDAVLQAGPVAAADAVGARGQGDARRARRRRAHGRRRRRLRALQHGLRGTRRCSRRCWASPRCGSPRCSPAAVADAAGSVGLAAAAIASGMADARREPDDAAAGGEPLRRVVRAARASRARSTPRRRRPRSDFTAPSGLMGPGQMFAVLAQRHMHLYGTKREHFAEVAISTRENAIRRETSLMKAPLTLDDYFAARMICRAAVPLRLLPRVRRRGRGGHDVARAGARPAPPAGVRHRVGARRARAAGVRRSRGWACPTTYFASSGHRPVAQRLYDDGRRRTAADVDVALLYDHFSPMVIMQLEDYGFCGIGEGGPFVGRRQHPLAERLAPGEHPRRQPVGGVHHRHDAREGSGRADPRHRGEPGRRRRGRARDRRPGVDPDQLRCCSRRTRRRR